MRGALLTLFLLCPSLEEVLLRTNHLARHCTFTYSIRGSVCNGQVWQRTTDGSGEEMFSWDAFVNVYFDAASCHVCVFVCFWWINRTQSTVSLSWLQTWSFRLNFLRFLLEHTLKLGKKGRGTKIEFHWEKIAKMSKRQNVNTWTHSSWERLLLSKHPNRIWGRKCARGEAIFMSRNLKFYSLGQRKLINFNETHFALHC